MANGKNDAMLLKGRKRDISSKGGHPCVCGKTIQGLPELRDHQLKCKTFQEEQRKEQGDCRRPTCRQ